MPQGTVGHLPAIDPLRNFKFKVTIDKLSTIPNALQMGFMNVSGLAANTAPIEYREGGNNTTTRKMPGQTSFPAVTMQHGLVVGNNSLWAWFIEIFHVVQGGGRGISGNDFRGDMTVEVLDHPISMGDSYLVKARFHLYNAWPSAISYSDLDAGGNGIVIETMTMEHEGFVIDTAAENQRSI